MGGNQSKTSKLDNLADSNSVRLKRDKKILLRKGEVAQYTPRRNMTIESKPIQISVNYVSDREHKMKKQPSITCSEDDTVFSIGPWSSRTIDHPSLLHKIFSKGALPFYRKAMSNEHGDFSRFLFYHWIAYLYKIIHTIKLYLILVILLLFNDKVLSISSVVQRTSSYVSGGIVQAARAYNHIFTVTDYVYQIEQQRTLIDWSAGVQIFWFLLWLLWFGSYLVP